MEIHSIRTVRFFRTNTNILTVELQAENVCFGFYATHVRWKCEYEDIACVQVQHNNVNVFVRTLKEQKQIKTYTVYLSFLETICK